MLTMKGMTKEIEHFRFLVVIHYNTQCTIIATEKKQKQKQNKHRCRIVVARDEVVQFTQKVCVCVYR